jgi:hypothetical protein
MEPNKQDIIRLVDKIAVRDAVTKLKTMALADTKNQVEIPVSHYFSKDVYAREMRMKAGELVIGKIHRHQNLCIISAGEVSLISTDGAMRVKAPYTFVSGPGAQRAIYAHSDTVWTVIHGTNETELETIEKQFIAADYEDLYLGSKRELADVLFVLGINDEDLKLISENDADQEPFSKEFSVEVRPSPIHGMGLFAKDTFECGSIIAPARISDKRTPAGRFSNHSPKPNAKMKMQSNGNVDLVAIKEIKSGEEIMTDYYYNYTNTRLPVCRG